MLVRCFREPRDLRSRAARFENDAEAIGIANDTPYGLAAVILTGNLGRALRLADRIRAGTVWLNTWHRYHPTANLAVIRFRATDASKERKRSSPRSLYSGLVSVNFISELY